MTIKYNIQFVFNNEQSEKNNLPNNILITIFTLNSQNKYGITKILNYIITVSLHGFNLI